MRAPVQLLTRFRANTAGAAAVEFAFVAPVLILLLLGSFQYGWILWTQNSLHYAVEQAVRCRTIALANPTTATNCTDVATTKSFAASKVHAAPVNSGAFNVYNPPLDPNTVCVSVSVPISLLNSSGFIQLPGATLSGQSCRAITPP